MVNNKQSVTNLCFKDMKRSQSKFGCFNGSFNHPTELVCTFDHVVLGNALASCNSVGGDVLDTLLEHGPDPNADVGRHNVHQPKPGEALELVDVQLKHVFLVILSKTTC